MPLARRQSRARVLVDELSTEHQHHQLHPVSSSGPSPTPTHQPLNSTSLLVATSALVGDPTASSRSPSPKSTTTTLRRKQSNRLPSLTSTTTPFSSCVARSGTVQSNPGSRRGSASSSTTRVSDLGGGGQFSRTNSLTSTSTTVTRRASRRDLPSLETNKVNAARVQDRDRLIREIAAADERFANTVTTMWPYVLSHGDDLFNNQLTVKRFDAWLSELYEGQQQQQQTDDSVIRSRMHRLRLCFEGVVPDEGPMAQDLFPHLLIELLWSLEALQSSAASAIHPLFGFGVVREEGSLTVEPTTAEEAAAHKSRNELKKLRSTFDEFHDNVLTPWHGRIVCENELPADVGVGSLALPAKADMSTDQRLDRLLFIYETPLRQLFHRFFNSVETPGATVDTTSPNSKAGTTPGKQQGLDDGGADKDESRDGITLREQRELVKALALFPRHLSYLDLVRCAAAVNGFDCGTTVTPEVRAPGVDSLQSPTGEEHAHPLHPRNDGVLELHEERLDVTWNQFPEWILRLSLACYPSSGPQQNHSTSKQQPLPTFAARFEWLLRDAVRRHYNTLTGRLFNEDLDFDFPPIPSVTKVSPVEVVVAGCSTTAAVDNDNGEGEGLPPPPHFAIHGGPFGLKRGVRVQFREAAPNEQEEDRVDKNVVVAPVDIVAYKVKPKSLRVMCPTSTPFPLLRVETAHQQHQQAHNTQHHHRKASSSVPSAVYTITWSRYVSLVPRCSNNRGLDYSSEGVLDTHKVRVFSTARHLVLPEQTSSRLHKTFVRYCSQGDLYNLSCMTEDKWTEFCEKFKIDAVRETSSTATNRARSNNNSGFFPTICNGFGRVLFFASYF
eukprot:PhM_4_TR11250/c0_g1_i1/m.70037